MAITIKLLGGLGNQLFQYAAGKAASIRLNTSLCFDTSYYESEDNKKLNRVFLLDKFNINAQNTSIETNKNKLELLIDRINNKKLNTLIKLYERMNKVYLDKRIMNPKDNSSLIGYWQNPGYFKEFEDVIRKELTLNEPITKDMNDIINIMKSKEYESISVHIRRTDYLTDALCAGLKKEYYEEALRRIMESNKQYTAFIFSDDIEWVKANMDFKIPTIYVSNNNLKDYQELILMSNCCHHIVANSSFSWWGAWLNPNINKKVVSPKNWFTTITSFGVNPKEWIELDNI